MIQPQFVYNPGGGDVTFIPTYPPINKQPFGNLNAVRHDSITSSGKRQSVLERMEFLNTLEFATVPQSDMDEWNSFLGYALGGGSFKYYPDHMDLATFTSYYLENAAWDPKRIAFQTFSFTLQLRKVVP